MALLNLRKFISAVAYPPGSIYCSTDSINLAEIWGGSWECFTQDHALVGGHSHTITIGLAGDRSAHNNIQPSITVYIWRRLSLFPKKEGE